jgi:hypothetical protein
VDVADQGNETAELFLRIALSNRKPVEAASTQCQWCEERPVEILPNGARAKYCSDCMTVATAA